MLGRRVAVLSMLVVAMGAQAQEDMKYAKRVLVGVKCTTPPVLDGKLDDECWKTAARAETWVDLFNNNPMEDQTIGYVCYDKEYIYAAFECRDSKPDQIHAIETVRDSKFAGSGDQNKEDSVSLLIDPYNTRKDTEVSEFAVNALGTPSAALSGGRGGKLEWKGNWESRAVRTPTGYTVEMRIPWRMLNFPNSGKPGDMGITFYRYHAREKRLSMWSNVTAHNFFDREGTWTAIEAPKISFKPTVSVLPYILPGATDKTTTFRSGVDVRSALTPDLTAVGTINPDFATIEGAVESIAFSRKEKYIQDRRPFFLEGQDLFSTGTRINDIGAMFYPRRIDSFDLGTKVYGKLNPVDTIGFQNMVTFGNRTDTSLRVKHALSDTSDVSMYVGNTIGSGLNPNSVLEVEEHAQFKQWGWDTQLAKTSGPGAGGGAVVLSGNHQQGIETSFLQYHSVSNLFNITDGYIPYKGYHGFLGGTVLQNIWQHGPWAGYSTQIFGTIWDHMDGSKFQRTVQAAQSFSNRRDQAFNFSAYYNEADDGTIDATARVGFVQGVNNRFLQYGLGITTGRLASQPATYLEPSGSVRLFKKLDLGYSGSLLNLQGVTQQHTITMGYELSPTRSFGGRIVMQDRNTNWYLSYRSAGGTGTDFYVIVGDPNATRFKKQIQCKWVFAF